MKIEERIQKALNVTSVKALETVQSLWSGYGKISRWQVEGSGLKTVIAKEIRKPAQDAHPKGWNSNLSHQRKMKSYQVEMNWYEQYASNCDEKCRLPNCYFVEKEGEEQLLLLEDLDAVGFPLRRTELQLEETKVCLHWLANFHATFMQVKAENLWETGTYWHLGTRPDEFEKMEAGWLKDHAEEIDQILSNAQFQTLVHGDAKVANFCFSEKMEKVAAVDFQYVGGGCGMKDVEFFWGGQE